MTNNHDRVDYEPDKFIEEHFVETSPLYRNIRKYARKYLEVSGLDIETNLKDIFYMGNLDFFYSLRGDVGPSHVDDEHVIILGIKNITYYHMDNIDFKIEPGDVLYISKGFLHHSFSPRERIVLSLSLWEK